MRSSLALAVSFVGMIYSVNATLAQVNAFSGSGCGGSEVTAYIDVSDYYCFQGVGGNSIGGFSSSQENCEVTTWSGNNCEGSSQTFAGYDLGGCYDIPYASLTLEC
jgi:hypothetical protein